MSFASRAAVASLALACLAPVTAIAGPTVGVAIGSTQAEGDANSGAGANSTLGLFVRGRVSRAFQVQAEIGKLETDAGTGSTIRNYDAAALFDLGRGRSRLVPFLLADVGLDVISENSAQYNSLYSNPDAHYFHAAAGIGLEYRFAGGFVVGADVRIGTRSNTAGQATPQPVGIANGVAPAIAPAYVASSSLAEGQYRSARLTLGVHF